MQKSFHWLKFSLLVPRKVRRKSNNSWKLKSNILWGRFVVSFTDLNTMEGHKRRRTIVNNNDVFRESVMSQHTWTDRRTIFEAPPTLNFYFPAKKKCWTCDFPPFVIVRFISIMIAAYQNVCVERAAIRGINNYYRVCASCELVNEFTLLVTLREFGWKSSQLNIRVDSILLREARI